MALSHCAKSNFEAALVGTWEWSGHACDNEGRCKKEIITDEGSRETFNANGLYLSKHARNNYIVKNKTIYFASDKDEFNTVYAEIISINKGVMLLRFDNDIRRYNRIRNN
jgi:hypothetical protein